MDNSITRKDLPAVVKRAAELAALEGDAEEQLPEDEVKALQSELNQQLSEQFAASQAA